MKEKSVSNWFSMNLRWRDRLIVDSFIFVNQPALPPHLKIAETVTAEEYAKAKQQQVIVYSTALILGVVVVVILFVLGLAAIWSLAGGGLLAIGCERVMDQMFPEGKKMRTQRMKVFPELIAYRKRIG